MGRNVRERSIIRVLVVLKYNDESSCASSTWKGFMFVIARIEMAGWQCEEYQLLV